jgi:hypothetical protein
MFLRLLEIPQPAIRHSQRIFNVGRVRITAQNLIETVGCTGKISLGKGGLAQPHHRRQ